HDDWKLTPDGHVQLYVILISIENIERNGSDKNSKLERLGVALRATLKVPRTQDKSAIDWKVKYQSLCTKIATIYHDYTYSTNKLIHGLALIDLFAELGELLKHPDMNKLIKQAPSPAVTQALTAFINFRDTEYHAGGMPLKQQVEQVQNHYIVLVEYLHHIRNNILPAQNYKA
ncbi:MAG TPA: hypothetical protein VI522_08750, partial [Gammaproteobacteria bacterium]|nr:hypothetical protein [Gammaproteobacteria bacterium]